MNNLLSKEDFGDLSKFDGLSPFDCLLIVAEKARKKRVSRRATRSRAVDEFTRQCNSDIRLPHQKISRKQKEMRMVENNARRKTAVRKKRVHPRRPAVPEHEHAVLPERFREKIRELHGSEPEFVIEKELTNSDFNNTQHRLLMPKNKCAVNLDDVGFDSKVRMIAVLHPNQEPHERVVTFTYWESTSVYVFKSEWIHFISQTTHLHRGDTVRVWTFRYPSGEYGFAVVKVE